MYQALYRTYRPKTFDEVLGQEHIVRILKNQLAGDALSHAYLFCGTRGTGKTTMARLLAAGINCLEETENGKPCGHCANCRAVQEGTFIDVIEIDAASNNGVDDVRALKESVLYPPAVGRKKVYIIDEVHMLSNSAFNALLKTLEEPPEYVLFALCTTEPEKLLQTVLSRCLRLDFRRVPEAKILEGMKRICADLGIEAEEDALRIAAVKADGSVRDGLSILDQCLSGGDKKIGKKEVLEYLGTAGQESFLELTEYILNRKLDAALLTVQRLLADGKDVRQLLNDFLEHYRGLLIVKFVEKPEEILGMSSENIKRLRRQSERFDLEQINQGIIELSKTIADAKWSNSPRVLLELCIVKLCGTLGAVPVRPLVQAVQAASPMVTVSEAASSAQSEATAPAGKAIATERTVDNSQAKNTAREEAGEDEDDSSAEPYCRDDRDELRFKEREGARLQGEQSIQEEQQTAESAAESTTESHTETAVEGHATQVAGDYEIPAEDLDEIWQEVCDRGGFNALRDRISIHTISGDVVVLKAQSRMAKANSESHLTEIKEHLSAMLGRLVRAEVRLEDELSADGGASDRAYAEETARKIEERLGVKVSIEE